jgi:myo-inositol 2-dehydrogenase / D-chiro-inositol 1-dehydrogenase
VRIAVIGTGRMGGFRAEQLRARGHDAVVASGNPGRGRPLADVLAEDVAAAIVSSSTDRHPDHVLACVERGLPVLCEKPIALTLRDTREVLDRVAAAGGTLQVSFQRRFDPGFAAARAAIAEGQLGTLYLIRLNSHDHEPSPEHYIPTSGGMFRDLHVHDFDIARWLTGTEVTDVYSALRVRRWQRFLRHGDADTSAGLLMMSDGTPVLLSGTRHGPHGYDFRAELFGSGDSVAVGLGPRTPIRSLDPDGPGLPEHPWRGFLDRFGAAFEAELDAWLESVAGERANPCPGEEALEALRVAVACDLSAREGRPVRVEEVTDDAP